MAGFSGGCDVVSGVDVSVAVAVAVVSTASSVFSPVCKRS